MRSTSSVSSGSACHLGAYLATTVSPRFADLEALTTPPELEDGNVCFDIWCWLKDYVYLKATWKTLNELELRQACLRRHGMCWKHQYLLRLPAFA